MADAHETPSGSLHATGERLVPDEQHGELVHAEHVARYRFAVQLTRGRRVLDAACGEGYGTAILAAGGAESVVGVELDPVVVEHARARYGPSFEVGDVAELPFGEDVFDLVVSFETIEHVTDAPRVLAEFRRVLKGDGTLLISTPNKHEYLVDNEFHTREYTHEEFAGLLGELFPSVQILLQHNWLVSTVSDESFAGDDSGELRHDADLYKLVGIEPGRELYSVALCASAPQAIPGAVAVGAGTDEAHRLAVRLTSAEEVAERWHGEFLAVKETAEERHREFESATESAAKWHGEYLAAEKLSEELRTAYDRSHAALEKVYGSASWRITEPLRRIAALVRARRG